MMGITTLKPTNPVIWIVVAAVAGGFFYAGRSTIAGRVSEKPIHENAMRHVPAVTGVEPAEMYW